MRSAFFALPLVAVLAAGGCATLPPAGGPAVAVQASGETAPVGTANEDAADDPAIWANPADPAAGLVVATDKKGGLYVYGLDGSQKSFTPAGRVNNVDLVDLGTGGIVVIASDRNDPANAKLQVYLLDPQSAQLRSAGALGGGTGEAYGVCARRDGTGIRVASILKDGTIYEQKFSLLRGHVPPVVTAMPPRKVPTQAEGCVYDPRDGALYVAEEDAGIWRFPPAGPESLVAHADGAMLVADVEGLAIAPEGTDGGYLVASSQGDSAYAVFRLPGFEPVGRFRIAAGTFGATEETDGIDLSTGNFGAAYPGGLFVAQDGQNAPHAQNFKLVPWQAIRDALGL
ncbi:MAG: phytase [Sphingomonadales bacterium]|nr:phytase [Sphingomonadales bacterium]MBD3772959.1 phytase [Paracoccaceae bacterium]